MRQIKLILYIVLISVLTIVFVGCGDTESNATPSDIMAKVKVAIPEKEMIDGVSYIGSGKLYESASDNEDGKLSDEMISEIYNSDFSIVEDYSVWISENDSATEIGVFKLKEIGNAEKLKKMFSSRVETLKIKVSKDEEILKLENAVISSEGKYVYYLVTNINSILEEVILNEIAHNQVTA